MTEDRAPMDEAQLDSMRRQLVVLKAQLEAIGRAAGQHAVYRVCGGRLTG
jgi:hypothetical protein